MTDIKDLVPERRYFNMQNNNYQAKHRRGSSPAAREMQQGFDDWVRGLRSIEQATQELQRGDRRRELAAQELDTDDEARWYDDGGESG
jgi:hypothetical protein